MITFVASCLALLTYLWLSFGGSLPLASQGYRITVEFNQAVQLGAQANVDIAGVPIGRVLSVGLDRHTGLSRAVLQIDAKYAPRPADTRAILRQKTLLGETYVELTFGDPHGGMLHAGDRLPQAQVAPTVQLDQVLSTFDPKTRRAFQIWMQDSGIALTKQGQSFSNALVELYPFASNVSAVLAVLRRDGAATGTLLADGGQVFRAVGHNPAQLQGLIRNADAVFGVTAARNRELAAAVSAFPRFLQSARQAVQSLSGFAALTKPLVDVLKPAARQLGPALVSLSGLAPTLARALQDLGPLSRAAKAGVPALAELLASSSTAGPGSAKRLFSTLTPYLGQLVPVLDYLGAYRRELAAFFANGAASTQGAAPAFNGNKRLNYLRFSAPLNPEELAAQPQRPYSNRANAYAVPGGSATLSGATNTLGTALDSFGTYLCTTHPLPQIPTQPGSVSFQSELPLFYGGGDATRVPSPACRAQPRLGAALGGALGAGLGSASSFYPQLKPLP